MGSTVRRRLSWSIRAPPRILSYSAVCASCGSLQLFMMLTSASGIFFAEHNTLADALSRWDNTSSQTQFAQATTALGISYVFEEIPGDFCYFDVDWYFFAFVIVFFGFVSSIQLFRYLWFLFFRDLYHCIFIRCLCSAFSSFGFRPIDS